MLNIVASCFFIATATFHTSKEGAQNQTWNNVHDFCVATFVILKCYVAGKRRLGRFLLHLISFAPFIFMDVWENKLYAKEAELVYQKYQTQLKSEDEIVVIRTKKLVKEEMLGIRRDNYSAPVCIVLEVLPLLALYYPWDGPHLMVESGSGENGKNGKKGGDDGVKVQEEKNTNTKSNKQ